MMKKTYKLALAGILATMALAPSEASAEEYCREYTRTISVGGRIQEGYGQACLMPDGDWRIRNEQVRYVTRETSVYENFNQPVYYAPERVYYRNQPVRVVFVNPPRRQVFHNHGWGNRNVIFYSNNKRYDRNDRWDRYDRHDRDDHRGRGRGHDKRH